MARRSAELAIVRGFAREVQSVSSPPDAEILALENEISIHQTPPAPLFLNHVVERIHLLTQADGVAVAVRDQWGVVCRASTGDAPEVGSRLRPDSALTRECLETGEVVICDDTETDPRVDRSIAKSLRLRSALVVPLRARGSVQGVVEILSSRAFAFNRKHVASLQRIAAVLEPILAQSAPPEPVASGLLPLPISPATPRSNLRKYLAALVIFLLLIFLSVYLLKPRRRSATPSGAVVPASAPATYSPSPVTPSEPPASQAAQGEAAEQPLVPHDLSFSELPEPKRVEPLSTPLAKTETKVAEPEKTFSAGSNASDVPQSSIPALVVQGAPPGAQIFVDDRPSGSINETGQASIPTLAPGQHRLRLKLAGHQDYDQSVEVKSDKTSAVTAKLEPFQLPISSPPISAPMLAAAPAIPPPVVSVRTPLPDFTLQHTLKGHTGWVTTMAFSPDGERLATGSWDQTVKIWEASSGEQLSSIARKNKEIQALAFSRDGRWLATENSSNSVSLRDAASGQEVRTLASDKPLGPLGSNWVYSIAFSPDGRWLATGVDDKTVRVWDVATGSKVRDFTASPRRVIYIAFSPDGRLLASGDDDKTIRIWNLASGEPLKKLSGHRKSIYAVAFSPNGRLLASASGDRTVKLWDVESGREIHTLTGHGNVVTSVAFSPDGRWLVSGSWDKTVKVWEVATGREVQTLSGHEQPVYTVAFDSGGHWLASGGEDGTIKLWRFAEVADKSRTR